MNRIKIFLRSVQNEFATERRRIADYIRQDAFNQDEDFRAVIWSRGEERDNVKIERWQ